MLSSSILIDKSLYKTRLTFKFPPGIYAELNLLDNPSRIEPLVAPGLITNGLVNIHVLCANLNRGKIKIKKNQIISYIKLKGIEHIYEIHSFGDLSKLGLPSDNELVNLTLDIETLEKIPDIYKEKAISLFSKFDDIFAKTSTDIGIYNGGVHKIDTGSNPPFKSCAIRRLKAAEEVAES